MTAAMILLYGCAIAAIGSLALPAPTLRRIAVRSEPRRRR